MSATEALANPALLDRSGSTAPHADGDARGKLDYASSQTKTGRAKDESRVPALDGVRGLAILLVVAHHATWIGEKPGAKIIDRLLALPGHAGWAGVDLFFVLSGFLITGILADCVGRPHYFRNFYARRALRIFPLYYLFVLIALVIVPLLLPANLVEFFGSTQGKGWMFCFYLSNFASTIYGASSAKLLVISWSLAIEEQFYIVWPLVIWLFRPRWAMAVCGAVIALAIGSRIGMIHAAKVNGWSPDKLWAYAYSLTQCRVDTLAIGALLALLMREPVIARKNLLKWSNVVGILGLAMVLFCLGVHRKVTWIGAPGQVIGYTGLGIVYAWVVLRAATSSNRAVTWPLTTKLMLTFGKYSYAVYLIHFPMQKVIETYWFDPRNIRSFHGSDIPAQLAMYGLIYGLSLAFAWVSWRVLESPMLSLKRFVPSHTDPSKPKIATRDHVATPAIAAPATAS